MVNKGVIVLPFLLTFLTSIYGFPLEYYIPKFKGMYESYPGGMTVDDYLALEKQGLFTPEETKAFRQIFVDFLKNAVVQVIRDPKYDILDRIEAPQTYLKNLGIIGTKDENRKPTNMNFDPANIFPKLRNFLY